MNTITGMLSKYKLIERVSEISTANRDKEPEMQNVKPCQFDYMLKKEERAINEGKMVPYVREGTRYVRQED